MRTIYKITAVLYVALGIVHLAVTPLIFKEFSERTLWFVSGGLMGIFVGFLNFSIIQTDGNNRLIKIFGMIANLLTTTFFVVGIIFVERSPLGFIGLFLIIAMSVLSFKFNEPQLKMDGTD